MQEGLDILQQKIKNYKQLDQVTDLSKDEIMELARMCTENPYFECGELGFFGQQQGAPMGGPLSRLLADLIVENKIEKKIKQHPRWKKVWDWVRLIDDTLSGWDSEQEFDEFFEYLNTLHPGIKWTCEKEEQGRLAIFDIQIIRDSEKLQTSVYRKSSASDRYIHYTSEQAWREKASAIRTLRNRAILYCSNDELLADELAHLFKVFIENGYPEKIITRILHEETKIKDRSEKHNGKAVEIDFEKCFYVPYHPRARRLYRMLEKEFGFFIAYKKTLTLGDLLLKKGRSIDKQHQKELVYSIPCAACDAKYIGQTRKSIKSRNARHKGLCRPVLKQKILNSPKKDNGLALHVHQTGHSFDFDNTKIITKESNYWRRLILEGIEIKFGENLVNLQGGYEIDNIWMPFLQSIYQT